MFDVYDDLHWVMKRVRLDDLSDSERDEFLRIDVENEVRRKAARVQSTTKPGVVVHGHSTSIFARNAVDVMLNPPPLSKADPIPVERCVWKVHEAVSSCEETWGVPEGVPDRCPKCQKPIEVQG